MLFSRTHKKYKNPKLSQNRKFDSSATFGLSETFLFHSRSSSQILSQILSQNRVRIHSNEIGYLIKFMI